MINRITRIIKGWMSNSVSKLEYNNIDALIANVLNEQEKMTSSIKQKAIKSGILLKEMEANVKKLKFEVASLKDQIRKALQDNDESLAGALAQKHQLFNDNLTKQTKAVEQASKVYSSLESNYEKVYNYYESRITELKAKANLLTMRKDLDALNNISSMDDICQIPTLVKDLDKIISKQEFEADVTADVEEKFKQFDKNIEDIDDSVLSREQALAAFRSENNI